MIRDTGAGECGFDEKGNETSKESLTPITLELLETEVERILIMARETLDIGTIRSLPAELKGQLDGILEKYNLQATPPEIAKEAEEEIGAIIVQMMLKDPFFGQFISGCVQSSYRYNPDGRRCSIKKICRAVGEPCIFYERTTVQRRALCSIKT